LKVEGARVEKWKLRVLESRLFELGRKRRATVGMES